jgi:hypothetical protein
VQHTSPGCIVDTFAMGCCTSCCRGGGHDAKDDLIFTTPGGGNSPEARASGWHEFQDCGFYHLHLLAESSDLLAEGQEASRSQCLGMPVKALDILTSLPTDPQRELYQLPKWTHSELLFTQVHIASDDKEVNGSEVAGQQATATTAPAPAAAATNANPYGTVTAAAAPAAEPNPYGSVSSRDAAPRGNDGAAETASTSKPKQANSDFHISYKSNRSILRLSGCKPSNSGIVMVMCTASEEAPLHCAEHAAVDLCHHVLPTT